MAESSASIAKPEPMKSYIWLRCADGSIQQVEEELAMFCPLIRRERLQKGMGSSKDTAITLPEEVHPAVLSQILDFGRFHLVPGRSDRERKIFDRQFIKMDTDQLWELSSAAYSLQLRPLVNITSQALALIIEGKTPEEIRETFHLPDDLTEEEKLEHLQNPDDDPQIRLLNRLNAKKREELQRQKLKDAEVKMEPKDERSIEELLSFINGEGGTKAGKGKKKNRRKGHHDDTSRVQEEETSASSTACNGSGESSISGQTSVVKDHGRDPFGSKVEFDDFYFDYVDDELDPEMQEQLDREMEEFKRRLNCPWYERLQDFSSSRQETTLLQNPTKKDLSGGSQGGSRDDKSAKK